MSKLLKIKMNTKANRNHFRDNIRVTMILLNCKFHTKTISFISKFRRQEFRSHLKTLTLGLQMTQLENLNLSFHLMMAIDLKKIMLK